MNPQRFEGQFITLTTLDVAADVAELFAISHGDEKTCNLWRYMPRGPFANAEEYAAFLHEWQATPNVVVFIVRDAASARILGTISLMSIRADHRVAELGWIWYAPAAQRTKANTEACYLLLRHCFETLHYRRMEWKCDARNAPSRAAALRLGFTFEGIFRQHMIIKGENRDTAWFAMLDNEWPQIASSFRHWLYEDGSIPLGRLIAESRSVQSGA
ncbi:GNAT family N-acetyltransferase [Prosthecobacter sp.]|uniref:GNAT family N-acetyltransferase n=1 Tax=Prosthecobacter sp. TaxID=1965333 RepID=UPI003784BF6A